MSLDVWQGAEQEFAAGSQPVGLFQALAGKGVYTFRPPDNIPRAHLRNGGVCYIHSNLFEVCTPECRNPLELVAYDKASEAYARLASWAYEELTGKTVHLYKTNIASDPKGELEHTTVGAHENYLLEREGYADKTHLLIPFLILRQLFCGAGGYVGGRFMVSPRAIFPVKVYSEVSTDYPVISLRDESHAGKGQIRAHIVYGEGARSEYTTFLKHSVTGYVLQAIQKGIISDVPELRDPIRSGLEISENVDGDWSVELKDGGRIGALDYLNSHYLEAVERLFSESTPAEHDKMALNEFKWVLGKLGDGLLESLDTSIEWVIKLNLIERGLRETFSLDDELDEASAKETAAFQYTAVTDPLYDDLAENHGLRRMVSDEDIERAFLNPPVDSRASLRTYLAEEFGDSLETLSWSYIKTKIGRRRQTFNFEDLDGWSPGAIERKVAEISSKLRET